ncbi:MAG: ABC transporter permease [Armatimonadota bacterium]|nr:ABC transporter permease [Armatimonadota bacterium]MDR7485719.1 ABC transporter permease [Armatimonadota bacterium]MDR7534164.1 ABC transporter permease [Armatimonadota bacterium]MDR7536383.1 ABC transporter permease [Armatimonadota bacterium]
MSLGVFVDPELLRLTVVMAVPLGLAALGELLTERSGVLNLAIEGTLLLGAVCGFLGVFFTRRLEAGMLLAATAGAVVAALLAYYAVVLRRDQVTVGLVLYVLTVGLASLLYRLFIGVQVTPQRIPTLPALPVPALATLPVVGPILFQQHVLVYGAAGLAVAVHVVLLHTTLGLRLRAAGENPRAADAVGVNVFALRYGATVVGGALMGLAGATLPMTITGTFTEGMSAGRGWIALMLVIFGRWRPGLSLAGAVLFAYVEALQFRLALVTRAVPTQALLMLPYLFAIVVLVRVFRGAEAPAALGRAYAREART